MAQTAKIHENKMGYMPVKKQIVSMSLPMMVSMMVQALYNIVDSIFVSQISESALTAVTIAFPLQNLMIAVGSGTGVSINALLSRSLGEKNQEQVDKAANSGIFLNLISFGLFLVLGAFASGPFIATQTGDPEIIGYGVTYLRYVCMLSFGLFFQMTFERLLQSTGLTMQSMASQLAGAVFNIIMDPVLIFGIGPFPEMGVAGAALATVLGQMRGASIGLGLNLKYNSRWIHFSLKKVLRPDRKTVGRIYYVGIPSILMMAIGSVMTYLMDLILAAFSSTAIAVFGVYFKLQSIFFMPIFGLNNGLIPVLAYNLGAREETRIKEALRFAAKLAVLVMCAGTLVFEFFPGPLLRLFNASAQMESIGKAALRIIAIHFPLAGLSIVLSSTFQAFSRSFYSLIVSVSRQLLVLIPVAFALARLGNVDLVWFAFPIAEVVSLIVTLIFFRKIRREVIETLG